MTTTGPSRDDSVTTHPACPSCHQPLEHVRGRQRFCSPACRQRAYRHRHPQQQTTATAATTAVVAAAGRGARATGVYQCPDCDSRYIGQQRCDDCNIFCHRIGTGGHCPSCDEPVTIDDLLPA